MKAIGFAFLAVAGSVTTTLTAVVPARAEDAYGDRSMRNQAVHRMMRHEAHREMRRHVMHPMIRHEMRHDD